MAQHSGATHAVCMNERGWVAELRVPWSAFGMNDPPPAGSEWRINVGRYNITSNAPFDSQAFQMAGGGERELSASAPLTVGSFHNYEEFNTLVSQWLHAQNSGVGKSLLFISMLRMAACCLTGIRTARSSMGGHRPCRSWLRPRYGESIGQALIQSL